MAHGPVCHCVARAEYRKAVSEFEDRRAEYARGEGVPAALAHSESGRRQWISDELALRAATLAERARQENEAWLRVLGTRFAFSVWVLVPLVVCLEFVTEPAGEGWTRSRTALLVAVVVCCLAVTVVSWIHRGTGGVFGFLRGEDGRLSVTKALTAGWVLVFLLVFVFFAGQVIGAPQRQVDHIVDSAVAAHQISYLLLLAAPFLAGIAVARWEAVRADRRLIQWTLSDRAQVRDLVTDRSGEESLPALQLLLFNLVAVVFVLLGMARAPKELPGIPWALTALAVTAAVLYAAGRAGGTDRPLITSVIRHRTPGDLDAAIRQGDDIEIRGAYFVPRCASTPHDLARVVVTVGPVHVNVPLVPTDDGFTNPSDRSIIVPVPVEVEPGMRLVRVVTASGLETNRYEIEVAPTEEH